MISLQPAIEIIRQRVVEESTLLQIRESHGLSWPVQILRRAITVTYGQPWARLLDTLSNLRKHPSAQQFRKESKEKGRTSQPADLHLCTLALADTSTTDSDYLTS